MHPIAAFVIVCLLAGVFLWAIGKMTTLDAAIVNFIRIAILVVLSIWLIDLVVWMIFGHHISGIWSAGPFR